MSTDAPSHSPWLAAALHSALAAADPLEVALDAAYLARVLCDRVSILILYADQANMTLAQYLRAHGPVRDLDQRDPD